MDDSRATAKASAGAGIGAGIQLGYRASCRPDPVDERDYRLSSFIDTTTPIPSSVTYVDYIEKIESQKLSDACVGYALTTAKETQDKAHGDNSVALSPWWLFDKAKQIDEEPYQEGTYLRLGLKILAKYGCAPESMVPFDGKYTFGMYDNLVLPEEVIRPYRIKSYARIRTVEEMCRQLALFGPFAMGIKVTDEFDCAIDKEWIPLHYRSITGGHAVAVVGYSIPEESFTIANSWGLYWGKGGIAKVPFEYWRRFGFDAWGIVDISPNEA